MSQNSPDHLNSLLCDLKLGFDDTKNTNMEKSVNRFLWKLKFSRVAFLEQLNRSEIIAAIECRNNGIVERYNILQQIQMAKDFKFEGNITGCKCKAINALNHIPLYDVLIHCVEHIEVNSSEITLLLDDNRTQLIENLFQSQPFECVTNPDPHSLEHFQLKLLSVEELLESTATRFNTNQIIFDNGDYLSAFDALVTNLTEPVNLPWRIKTVFIQETLREFFFDFVSADNSIFRNNTIKIEDELDDFGKEIKILIKRTNGRLFQNVSETISLLVDVPTNHITTSLSMQGSVAVNFFRTTKEICHRINNIKNVSTAVKYASIWTENISVLYDVALNIRSSAIWNNCYKIFGEGLLCPVISHKSSSITSDSRFVNKISITFEIKIMIFIL